MSSVLKICSALVLLSLIAACCKDPIIPNPPNTPKRIGTVYAKVIGILPNSFAHLLPLSGVRIERVSLLMGISTTSGIVRLDSLIEGQNILQFSDASGQIGDTTLTLVAQQDSTLARDTIVFKIPLTAKNAHVYNFTIPLAIGNEWTYDFNEQVYELGARGSAKLLYTYTGTLNLLITKIIRDTGSFDFDKIPRDRYVGRGIRNMTVIPVDSGPSYRVSDTLENILSIGYSRTYTGTPITVQDTILGFNFINPFSSNRWQYSVSMKSIISPQSTLLKNDTLDSRIYGLATIGYAYVKFVNNVGMVYLQSGASTAAIPYKTNNSTYTLKSYKLVTP